MFYPLFFSPWVCLFFFSSSVDAVTAFERAKMDAPQGPYAVDSLLIGCTTHKDQQKEMDSRYCPKGCHAHSADEWVSYDQDADILPDICAPVEQLEQQIRVIQKKVYIEHFNDNILRSSCYTYRGELVRKVFSLMNAGAEFYMDYSLAMGDISERDLMEEHPRYYDESNSPWTETQYDVNPKDNPFWIDVNLMHFKNAFDHPKSASFQGKEQVLSFIQEDLIEDPQFMKEARSLWRSRGYSSLEKYLHAAAVSTFENVLSNPSASRNILKMYMHVFYGAKLESRVIRFLTQLGFQNVRIEKVLENPFNQRKGGKMMRAVKP